MFKFLSKKKSKLFFFSLFSLSFFSRFAKEKITVSSRGLVEPSFDMGVLRSI